MAADAYSCTSADTRKGGRGRGVHPPSSRRRHGAAPHTPHTPDLADLLAQTRTERLNGTRQLLAWLPGANLDTPQAVDVVYALISPELACSPNNAAETSPPAQLGSAARSPTRSTGSLHPQRPATLTVPGRQCVPAREVLRPYWVGARAPTVQVARKIGPESPAGL